MSIKEAIEIIDRIMDEGDWTDDAWDALLMGIQALEDFKKYPKDNKSYINLNNDMIYRQAAIDMVYHHLPMVSLQRAQIILDQVPSVYSRLTKCKDCRFCEQKETSKWCSKWRNTTVDNDFCSRAERAEEVK